MSTPTHGPISRPVGPAGPASVGDPEAGVVRASGWSVVDVLSAAGVVAGRDVRRQLGRPGALAAQALQIVFFLLVYAIGFSSMVHNVGGVAFSAYVFPGIVAIHVVSTGINAGLTYAWDRTYGFMRELLVAPVPRWTVLAGKMVASATVVACHAAILLVMAPLVGVPLTSVSFGVALLVCAGSAAAFCGFGLLLAVAVARAETLQQVVQLALYPMLFLSTSVFRPDQIPSWLAWVMTVNPVTYVVDLLRHALLASGGSPFPALAPAWTDALVLATFAGVTVGCGRWRIGR